MLRHKEHRRSKGITTKSQELPSPGRIRECKDVGRTSPQRGNFGGGKKGPGLKVWKRKQKTGPSKREPKRLEKSLGGENRSPGLSRG